MKNILIVVGGLIVIAGAGFGLTKYFGNENNSDQRQQPASQDNAMGSDKSNTTPTEEANQTTKNGGEYLEKATATIADASNDEIYLFFHAPWCPQCRSIESGIKSDGVPEGITIIKVDYDSNQDLRAKYGVTLQTTFVKVNKNSEFVSKFVAYNDPQFSAVLRDYIDKS